MALRRKDGCCFTCHDRGGSRRKVAHSFYARVGDAVHAWASKICYCSLGFIRPLDGLDAVYNPSSDSGIFAWLTFFTCSKTNEAVKESKSISNQSPARRCIPRHRASLSAIAIWKTIWRRCSSNPAPRWTVSPKRRRLWSARLSSARTLHLRLFLSAGAHVQATIPTKLLRQGRCWTENAVFCEKRSSNV